MEWDETALVDLLLRYSDPVRVSTAARAVNEAFPSLGRWLSPRDYPHLHLIRLLFMALYRGLIGDYSESPASLGFSFQLPLPTSLQCKCLSVSRYHRLVLKGELEIQSTGAFWLG